MAEERAQQIDKNVKSLNHGVIFGRYWAWAEFKRSLAAQAHVTPTKLNTNFLAMLAPMLFGTAWSLMTFLPG